MDEKRIEELTDDALDAVSGGYNIGGVSIEDCPTITVSHLPGAPKSTLGRPPVEPGGVDIPSGIDIPRGRMEEMQAQLDAKMARLSAESGSLPTDRTIRDVDIEREYSKDNVLQQAQRAMNAQQNSLGLGLSLGL